MNFYEILEITPQSTKNEIKKAYHKLVILNHPDKNNNPDAKQKFQDIQSAYEILSDEEKRKKYDLMSMEQKIKFYDLIKQYFTDIRPQYYHFYDSIINYIYSNQEDEFENDINNFNIKKIFNRIIDKIRLDKINKELNENVFDVINNEIIIKVTLREKFENKFKCVKIRVDKNNNSFKEYIIPLQKEEFYINDIDSGNLKIKIICEPDKFFKQINESDLLCIRKISLSQYLYGGKIKLHHLDGELISFEFPSCLEMKPIFILENKGLHKLNLEDDDKIKGNLYIYLTIEGINSSEDDEISQKYTKIMEETIKLMFPPIEN